MPAAFRASVPLISLALLALAPAPMRAQIDGENLVRFRAADIEVTLRFRDNRATPLERQLREAISQALDTYMRVFGAPPRALDGIPTAKVTLNVAMGDVGGATAEPGLIALLVGREPPLGMQGWKPTLLHETFHLWNRETFRNAGPAEQWFNEGVTEFYAMQAAARSGMREPLDAIRMATAAVALYDSARNQGQMALAQAGTDMVKNHSLVQYGGYVAALLLDRAIRDRTANAKSLDDVMRWMLAHHDRESRKYNNVDVARAVREATGQDVTEFFARYVMGRLPLPAATLRLRELASDLQGGPSQSGATAEKPDTFLLQSLGLRPR